MQTPLNVKREASLHPPSIQKLRDLDTDARYDHKQDEVPAGPYLVLAAKRLCQLLTTDSSCCGSGAAGTPKGCLCGDEKLSRDR